jgi:hypothetical protein
MLGSNWELVRSVKWSGQYHDSVKFSEEKSVGNEEPAGSCNSREDEGS